MTSRLDRLFILLESGSAVITRKAAAKQIGEVQRLHPHELHNLLGRLSAYLNSSSWDTRVAAALAVQAILENVPEWDPAPRSENTVVKDELNTTNETLENSRLTFDNFDLNNVLYKGARLLGSEGTEFDLVDETDTGDIAERLARQRAMLSEKLGLNTGVKIDELITMEDMRDVKLEPRDSGLTPVQEILDSNLTMSSREKNREKRKARRQVSNPMNSVTTPSRRSSCSSTEEPEKKRLKLEIKGDEPVPDGTGTWGDGVIEWPLETFCSKLFVDLFNPRWEKRHGAATALRELLKMHSRGAGKSTLMTKMEMEKNHQLWLEDAALRLLCVLALDRFGDFVSDQVIAPVRETCAQVLATVVKEVPECKVMSTIDILLKFVQQKEWEVRHGGLLGLKYIVVVREDLIDKFIPVILDHILIGMKDQCEDVAAVSASILIPIASYLPKLLTSVQVQNMVSLLWDLLLDQDELASACNSFMGLLATLLCNTGLANWIQTETLPNLVPRLWPFLSHNTTSVRKATLQTLRNITLPVVVMTNGIQISVNPVKLWSTELLQEALRHVYQRVLVEHVEDVQELVEKVWFNIITNADLSTLLHACCPYVGTWLCLAMQPPKLVYDPNMLIFAKTTSGSRKGRDSLDCSLRVHPKFYLGGTESVEVGIREKNVIRSRYKACRLLGLLSRYLVMEQPNVVYSEAERPLNMYTRVLLAHIKSRSAIQRVIGGLVVNFWAEYDTKLRPGPVELEQTLKTCLTEYVYYDETAVLFTRLLQEAQDFIATLKQHKIQFPQLENSKILTLDQIYLLCTSLTTDLKTTYSLRAKIADVLEERRSSIRNSHQVTSNEHNSLTVMIQAIMAGAIINVHALPNEKFAPYVKPLMESIKREENEILQRMAAKNLAKLIDQVINKNPCPNNKIITNLCTMLRCDPEFTPKVPTLTTKLTDTNQADNNPYIGILSLSNSAAPVRQNGARGRPSVSTTVDVPDDMMHTTDDTTKKQFQIQRNGAAYALSTICSFFEADLPKKLPIMWELLFSFIQTNVTEQYLDALYNTICPEQDTNTLINSLSLLEIVASHIHDSLHDELFGIAEKLTLLVRHPLKAIRHLAARCLSTLGKVNANRIMIIVIKEIVPLLSSIECLIKRQGAAETIALIINKLQFDIVPYVVLLIVPLLGRMSDQDEQIRTSSTQSFATLIQLMPLDGITPLTDELNTRKMKDKEFLEYLFSPKSIPDFHVPIPIKAELRSYQQSGVNWLWFLNKYKLHGILCDDMGLGKTLQAICILAGDHYHRAAEKETNLPSIVICPPTLTGHWVYEITKFVDGQHLRPLHYTGLPLERARLKLKIRSHNLVVASYDIVRKDIDFFASVHWNYCILDEGHIIKNGKTKSSKAIKQLIANHRLILSGTPIQNNVLDLWSLFDFLMPGFLGTEKQFVAKFSRPILASRDPKSSAKDQEGGALAMEALHRQVLPFLLRRVKEDVLTDLPPKITQDLLCELSPLQRRLYEDFSKVHLNSDIGNCLENMDSASLDGAKKTHIFQALRYLQNVCNHPKLVLNQNHPEYQSIVGTLQSGSLNDIEHSAKLPALKQLLLDCGIGSCSDEVSVNQHRALIFCQLKAMIDIIENDLLKKHLPSVTYLRLDGSIPASNRHSIVTKFNGDPSIDVLLLTTQVGGLGLNLTGADTVIFVEHDWNPMKDLQAMDRAHRIGQKKVVNVYRLITQNSLEEKIMGLQKFKLLTANTVVSDENASMETMGTDQLLDLFDFGESSKGKELPGPSSDGGTVGVRGVKQIIETLPELWEDQQYEEEYDLTQFIKGLQKNPNSNS